jgi:hypothetical protein
MVGNPDRRRSDAFKEAKVDKIWSGFQQYELKITDVSGTTFVLIARVLSKRNV